MSSDFDDVLAQMWLSFADLARTRVADLEAYSRALSAGTEPAGLRESAGAAAHKLAGALGSYGRRGSDEAGRLEVLLRGQGRPDPVEVASLVACLRAAVEA